MQGLDVAQVTRMMRAVAEGMIASTDQLTQLDKAIGDGDHGVGMERGFTAVRARLDSPPAPTSIDEVFTATGMALMSSIGGASGAVFGTLFRDGGKELRGKALFGAQELSLFLTKGLQAVKSRGGAQLGDKTMIDALEPAAVESVKQSTSTLGVAIVEATRAAQKGLQDTKGIVARKGKAKTLGERSLGHEDPGATSMYLILDFMRNYIAQQGTSSS
jgi:phosphoenolpyruvate---glycerone phosphotransferase subunit DhaL